MTGRVGAVAIPGGDGRRRSWVGPAMALLAGLIGAWGLVVGRVAVEQAVALGRVGADLQLYLAATRDWLAGGSFYHASQLAGPYVITDGDILYPPSTIPLFLPFLVLPSVLFMAIPVGLIAWVVARHRPAPWTWPVMAACLAFAPTLVKLVHFNPFVWSAAALALGTIYAWPSVFVLLKPSLAPFALFGIRHRSWWVAAGVFGLVALAFLPLWPDSVTVLRNATNPNGLLYSLTDAPLLLLPLVAWLGSTTRRSATGPSATASGAASPPPRPMDPATGG